MARQSIFVLLETEKPMAAPHKELLGGRDNLAKMVHLGIPVHSSFNINGCLSMFYANVQVIPEQLNEQLEASIKALENST